MSSLLKDQPYVILSYMTGILPISKYSEGSELNMFREYTLVTEETFSEEFGFVEDTGDILAVGIGYWKDSKKHECKVEKL